MKGHGTVFFKPNLYSNVGRIGSRWFRYGQRTPYSTSGCRIETHCGLYQNPEGHSYESHEKTRKGAKEFNFEQFSDPIARIYAILYIHKVNTG
jgi:hypothetical protein